jgi:DNA integrity scanning protein DisA with diadenylate cyclase activity
MKKTFWGMRVYVIAPVVGILIGIINFIVFLDGVITGEDVVASWVGTIISGFAIIFFFILLGYFMLQWVTVDEQKICGRNLFGKLREITWDDVREIRIERVKYAPEERPLGWLIFIEKKDPARRYTGGGMTKKSCIKIRYSRKAEEFLKQCHPEAKFIYVF